MGNGQFDPELFVNAVFDPALSNPALFDPEFYPLTVSLATVNEPWPASSYYNVAASANGSVASSSSNFDANYIPSATINGDRAGTGWGAPGGAWVDGTISAWPDWVQVDFPGPRVIDEVDVFTTQDAYTSPSAPTETMTFTLYGNTAFDVQYWTGSAWATVPGGSITGNNLVWRKVAFSPITTTAIRVVVNMSADALYSRISEIEAWGTDGPSIRERASVVQSVAASEVAPTTSALAVLAASTTNEPAPTTAATPLTIQSTSAETGPTTSSVAVTQQLTAINEVAPTTSAIAIAVVPPTINETAPTTSALAVQIGTTVNEAAPTTSTTPVLIQTTSAETGPSTSAVAIAVALSTVNEAGPTTEVVSLALSLTTINETGPTTENASVTAFSGTVNVSAAESGLPAESVVVTPVAATPVLAHTVFTSSESASVRPVVLVYPQTDPVSPVIPITVSTTPIVVAAPATTPIEASASPSVLVVPQEDKVTAI